MLEGNSFDDMMLMELLASTPAKVARPAPKFNAAVAAMFAAPVFSPAAITACPKEPLFTLFLFLHGRTISDSSRSIASAMNLLSCSKFVFEIPRFARVIFPVQSLALSL